ncbi:uncharacterized protein LOC131931546 [Physella acuta]|uniref:uncharacterized protein LOC131931546 n=1 Tax=Physella acuta TaxID=109671 RepID=UPI0027DAE01F|nr:uncharacterized protein LOC131931546 [Physella acuta]XP_059144364.1 uncharacterized protein LOC131931546 [Physella acuta]
MESNQAIDHDLHETNLLHVLKELAEHAEEIKQNNESFISTILQLQEECEGLRQKLEQEKNKAQSQNVTHTNLINSLKNKIKSLKQQLKSAEEVSRVALEENNRYKFLLDNQGSNDGCVIQKCGRFEIKKRLLECTRCHETFNSPSEMDKSVCCYHPKTPVKSVSEDGKSFFWRCCSCTTTHNRIPPGCQQGKHTISSKRSRMEE